MFARARLAKASRGDQEDLHRDDRAGDHGMDGTADCAGPTSPACGRQAAPLDPGGPDAGAINVNTPVDELAPADDRTAQHRATAPTTGRSSPWRTFGVHGIGPAPSAPSERMICELVEAEGSREKRESSS
jgi:hypothetical protein